MTIEQKRGNLIVNYSDRLVRLLREVRQLISLGFAVPRKIIECANTGEQFYKYAIILKQVEHFQNLKLNFEHGRINIFTGQILPKEMRIVICSALLLKLGKIPEIRSRRCEDQLLMIR